MVKFKTLILILLIITLLVSTLTFITLILNSQKDQRNIELQEQSLKNDGIQKCFESATITTKEGNLERKEPIFYIYELCIKDKGYETEYTRQ